ncbi:hypothetical protein HY546_00470 [archaeon]|nr:hypothetical protein [archaeon]
MSGTVIVTIDEKWRVSLPAWARKLFRTRKAIIHAGQAKQIMLEPLESVEEMFGSFSGLDIEGFRKEHSRER